MVSAIIVTHGDLGRELIATARSIVGEFDGCHGISNAQKSPQVLCDELTAIVDGSDPGTNFIVFVDFFGGSCCHACLSVEQERPNIKLISGVNLPMVLAFLNKRGEVAFEDLPKELISRGQNSIRAVDTESL